MKRWFIESCLVLVIVAFSTAGLLAQDSHESTNFEVREFFFGSGGEVDAQSANYRARGSLGDLGIGNVSSASYQAYGGFTTTDEEHLEFNIPSTSIDFGTLDSGTPATGSATFTVRNYLSHGYVVQTVSGPPTNGNGDTIAPMTSATTSSPGTEQFGMNLVANTSPTSYGANPVQVPDNTFSYGYASSGYDTANNYKYQVDDIIAQSDQASGETEYTISYLLNISINTEAGVYNTNHMLVATPTF